MNATPKDTDYKILSFSTQADFEAWLSLHHSKENGIWLKFYKKDSSIASIRYAEALDVALCFGWIDGQAKGVDEQCYLQKFTPRRAKSMWSKRNVEHVARLIVAGKMQPSGLAQIQAAKADGRFDQAYDSPSAMQIPADFLEELNKNANAKTFFQTLNKTNLYAIAWRLQTAKREETRQKRIKEIIEKLSKQELFHPKAV